MGRDVTKRTRSRPKKVRLIGPTSTRRQTEEGGPLGTAPSADGTRDPPPPYSAPPGHQGVEGGENKRSSDEKQDLKVLDPLWEQVRACVTDTGLEPQVGGREPSARARQPATSPRTQQSL